MNEDTQLAMLVPSRGRPQKVAELLESCMNITTTDTQVAVLVDDDDPALPEYQSLQYGQFAELVVVPKLLIPAPRKLGQILNRYGPMYARRHPYVGFMGDDHRPRTKGWDAQLIQALDKPGVAYGNDLLQGPNLPTACVVSSELILALGYMSPEPCEHLFLDNFWKQLGMTAGNLVYLKDVVVEHVHPAAGKTGWDEGYQRSMSRELMDADAGRYQEFLRTTWPQSRMRLEQAVGVQ